MTQAPVARATLASDQRGQALALGVFGLLVLAIGMYLIGSYGRHVQQKIHVQTTADSVALSLAQAEAESMNFIAFTNRAQVANYVSALNLQAYVSYVSWVEHASISLAAAAKQGAPLVRLIPVIGAGIAATMEGLVPMLFSTYQGATGVLNTLDPIAGVMTDRLMDLNKALWVGQMVIAWIVTAEVTSGGHEFFRRSLAQSDPQWATTSSFTFEANIALGLYNAWKFNNAFFRPGGTPSPLTTRPQLPQKTEGTPNDSEAAIAQRVMSELVNGTRTDQWILDRGILPLPGAIGDIANEISRVVDKVPLFSDFNLVKRGESKIVNRQGQRDGRVPTIYEKGFDDSMLNRGGVIASDDVWVWMEGSVWAKDNETSMHCRAKPGLQPDSANPFDAMQCEDQTLDISHKWAGIQPYMSYNVGRRSGGDNEDFHQPDVFVWIHKPIEQAGLPHAIDFTLTAGGESQKFSTEIGRSNLFKPGIHAIARAQAYYHRPGNWAEPPNLFNPFWRARLAPIDEGVAGIAGGLSPEVVGILTEFVGKNFLTH